MAFFHRKSKAKARAAQASRDELRLGAHRNHGWPSFDLADPLVALRVAAASC